MSQLPSAGWYLDPIGRQSLRWWDGAQWSQERRPLPAEAQEGQPLHPPQRQEPRQSSVTPAPQDATAPRQPTYQGQPQYPPPSSGRDAYPQGQAPHGQKSYLPHGHRQRSSREAPRKRRRVFLWVFLGIQALFVIWIITAVATVHTGPTQAQLVQGCYNGHWYPLFKSQADCVKHYGGALNDAGTAGKAIGVGLIIAFWVAVDVILGISYGIYRLARRSA